MNKKGDLVWDQIGKFILAIILMVILAFILWMHKDNIFEMFEDFKTIFRFGGV